MINQILYINPNLDIKPVLDFPDTKHFLFIDTLPRNNNMKKFSSILYKKTFYKDLVKIYKSHGFKLMEIIDINNKFYKKILTFKQSIYYFIFGLPQFINPTLLCFFNLETNQVVKYYISTDVIHNINSDIIHEINNCEAMIITEYLFPYKIFDYFTEPKICISYMQIDYKINDNIINKFNKFIYIDSNNMNDFLIEQFFDFTYNIDL